MYHSPIIHLVINGELSQAIYPTRGVKQGDPLSALLFVLSVEPLSQLLRNHEEYSLPFSEELFAMAMFFADDTTLVSSSLEDLERQLELVQEFCTQSGAKPNVSKCKVLTLNGNQDVPRHPRLSMVTSGTPTKYLGILFGHRLSDQVQINALSDSFYQSFITWGCRARTLRGRRLLANTMMLSKLWHYTAVIHIPEDTVAKWQSMVY
ncbi:hypothetical protein AeRB84_008395, partial [Aphanomyces euteiches]